MSYEKYLEKNGNWTKEEVEEMRRVARAIFIRTCTGPEDVSSLYSAVKGAMLFAGKYEDFLEVCDNERREEIEKKMQSYADLL